MHFVIPCEKDGRDAYSGITNYTWREARPPPLLSPPWRCLTQKKEATSFFGTFWRPFFNFLDQLLRHYDSFPTHSGPPPSLETVDWAATPNASRIFLAGTHRLLLSAFYFQTSSFVSSTFSNQTEHAATFSLLGDFALEQRFVVELSTRNHHHGPNSIFPHQQ